MNVLSLFDGMSCGMIALERAGIEVTNYYASEIDKYAQIVSEANYPEIIRMGDVTKWREWDIDWLSIDLLIGGSPCQGFSFAGKQLAFDDPRSALFFEYINILNHIKAVNPDVKFFLENVKMKKEYLDVISGLLGVEPMFINSALVSAQNRQRYYWANWEFGQPEDKGIMLADILETVALNPAAMVGRKLDENGNRNDKLDTKPVQRLEVHEHGKARCLSSVQKDTLVSSSPKGRYRINKPVRVGDTGKSSQGYRIYSPEGKSPCILCNPAGGNKPIYQGTKDYYRKLTPIECERLQTVPDNFTAHVSNTQRYKMLGNGWTVDVITHIFRSLK